MKREQVKEKRGESAHQHCDGRIGCYLYVPGEKKKKTYSLHLVKILFGYFFVFRLVVMIKISPSMSSTWYENIINDR